MALFGNVDANLPLIIQAAQVDVSNEQELRAFWVRCYGSITARQMAANTDYLEITGFTVADTFAQEQFEGEEYLKKAFQDDKTAGLDETESQIISPFRHVCKLVKIILEGLADGSLVNLPALMELRTYRSARNYIQLQKDYFETHDIPSTSEERIMVHIDGFTGEDFLNGAKRTHEHLVKETEELLTKVWIGAAQVTSCAECKSPYVPHRTDHKYCSHRCSNRAALRKKRQAEKRK